MRLGVGAADYAVTPQAPLTGSAVVTLLRRVRGEATHTSTRMPFLPVTRGLRDGLGRALGLSRLVRFFGASWLFSRGLICRDPTSCGAVTARGHLGDTSPTVNHEARLILLLLLLRV
jgi:hypothetical protein